ncbi:MAG: hypothetical protein AAF664_25170 [Planctomycetota bacterium]
MLLVLTSTAGNERGIRYSEQVFANLGRYPFTLLVLPINGSATLAVQCRPQHHHAIARELQAAYPDSRISKADDGILRSRHRRHTRYLTLWPCFFSLRPYATFWNETDRSITDPIASLLAAIAPGGEQVRAMIAVRCREVVPNLGATGKLGFETTSLSHVIEIKDDQTKLETPRLR